MGRGGRSTTVRLLVLAGGTVLITLVMAYLFVTYCLWTNVVFFNDAAPTRMDLAVEGESRIICLKGRVSPAPGEYRLQNWTDLHQLADVPATFEIGSIVYKGLPSYWEILRFTRRGLMIKDISIHAHPPY